MSKNKRTKQRGVRHSGDDKKDEVTELCGNTRVEWVGGGSSREKWAQGRVREARHTGELKRERSGKSGLRREYEETRLLLVSHLTLVYEQRGSDLRLRSFSVRLLVAPVRRDSDHVDPCSSPSLCSPQTGDYLSSITSNYTLLVTVKVGNWFACDVWSLHKAI